MTTKNQPVPVPGYSMLETFIYGFEKPHQFSPTTQSPLAGHGDMSWTHPCYARGFEETTVDRIRGQFSNHTANIKALKLAQPSVVRTERAVTVLTLSTIGLGIAAAIVGAKLFLPLIIVGSLLAVSLLLYYNMRGNISNEAMKLAMQHQRECTDLALDDPVGASQLHAKYQKDYKPVPMPKREPTTVKEYSDAYNEFVVKQMLGTGHSGNIF